MGQKNSISRRAVLTVGASLAADLAFSRTNPALAASVLPAAATNPYRHIRGFNYQPSWGCNGDAIWRHFDPELFRRELGRGKQYFPAFNTVRLWLSFDAFAAGTPEESRKVAANFETALAIAHSYQLKAIPVLFNNWHSVPDFGGIAIEMIEYWSNPQNVTIPANLFRAYLDAIVGAHASDERILLWDLCNEPFNSGVHPTISKWLQSTYRVCKELGARAPLAVGMAPDATHFPLLDPVCDVFTIHPYGNQKFLEAAVAYARQAGKPILATESCWGSLDDRVRAQIVEKELTALREQDLGFLTHVLHHSLVADCHRPQYGPVSGAGYMAFIEADGSLRPHHDIFNKFA